MAPVTTVSVIFTVVFTNRLLRVNSLLCRVGCLSVTVQFSEGVPKGEMRLRLVLLFGLAPRNGLRTSDTCAST